MSHNCKELGSLTNKSRLDPQPVIISHDGAGDDLLAMTLLLSYSNVRVIAIVLTPADSCLEPALQSVIHILNLLHQTDIPVFVNSQSVVNDFPVSWRDQSYKDYEALQSLPITNYVDIMVNYNLESIVDMLPIESVLFIETGPLTALARMLKIPQVVAKVKHVYWMGGKFRPELSHFVIPYGGDGSQSWNAYCDPLSANYVLESGCPLTMITQEVTEIVKITPEFYDRLPDTISGKIFKIIYGLVKG